MSTKVLIILCILANEALGELSIVSDLSPMDCLNNKQGYVDSDADYNLPHCVATITKKKACDRIFASVNFYMKPTNCQKDGFFGAKQCKGEPTTGRCFCFDKNGKRLYGEQWWPKADDMTCACSRKKADMELDAPDIKSENYLFYNSLHCNTLGNYEALQCDAISAQCWCADSQTGKLVSTIVPESAKSKLPCYGSQTVGSQYLRRCESKKFAQKKIEYVLKLHGTTSSFGDSVCDGDGAYGFWGTFNGAIYCTWRNNDKLGSYQFTGNKTSLNCNCARDKKYYELAGKEHNLECDFGGSYKRPQYTDDLFFCVDKDGYTAYPNPSQEVECDSFVSYDEV